MPQALRVEYPGAMYHIVDRGDRQERIFLDDVDQWIAAGPQLGSTKST